MYFLFWLLSSNMILNMNSVIIRNGDFPACKNCIHYRPTIFSNTYTSTFSKCANFGTKDITTDIIIYDFADSCRYDRNKCGNEGKYYQQDKYVDTKIGIFTIINIPHLSFIFFFITFYNYYNRKL